MPHHRKHTHHVTHTSHAAHAVQTKGPGVYVSNYPDPPPSPIGWTIAAVILILILFAIVASVVIGIIMAIRSFFIDMFGSFGSTSKNTYPSSVARSTPPRNPSPTVSAAARREVSNIDRERRHVEAATALINAKTAAEKTKLQAILRSASEDLYLKGK